MFSYFHCWCFRADCGDNSRIDTRTQPEWRDTKQAGFKDMSWEPANTELNSNASERLQHKRSARMREVSANDPQEDAEDDEFLQIRVCVRKRPLNIKGN